MKNRKIFILIIALLAIIGLAALLYENTNNSTGKIVNEYNVNGFSTDLSKIVAGNKSSIVSVEQGNNISTGFIYAKQGDYIYIVTSFHGVQDEENVSIYLNSGEKLKGTIVNKDIMLDIALVECECLYNIRTVNLGNSLLVKDGEFVIGIGTCNSLEYDFSSQFGMVSKNYRELDNEITYDNNIYNGVVSLIQLSGEFVNGYSGSPIFNMNGDVVGMITMKDEDITFALTANEIKVVIDKMINGVEYEKINLGVKGKFLSNMETYEIGNLNIAIDQVDGYYITNVNANSIASNIGIEKGDIIVSVNDNKISDFNSLLSILYSDDETYNFSIIRNNEQMNVTYNLEND